MPHPFSMQTAPNQILPQLRRSAPGHPCARREVIHALQGRPSTRSRKVIHALQGRRSTRCSTRSKGGDPRAPREVIHALRGRSPQAPRELITALKEGRSPRASGEAIHAIKGGHPRARGRPSTRSEEFIHAFRGRSSTRSKGGYPRAPREEEGDPRASWVVKIGRAHV